MNEVGLSAALGGYVNVMESLVAQEVERQLQQVSPRLRQYIKTEEVVTYALNRLPALYASSKRGCVYQSQQAERTLQGKIKEVVHHAIAAVQVDPIRMSEPLNRPQGNTAEAVLQALRSLFGSPDLDWPTALIKLNALKQRYPSKTGVDNCQQTAVTAVPTPSPRVSRQRRQPLHRHRPAAAQLTERTQSASLGELPRPVSNAGWEDARYQL